MAGFRHLRLRSLSNQPLELASLFIFSRLDESAPDTSSLPQQHDQTSPASAPNVSGALGLGEGSTSRKSAKTLLGRWKDSSVDNSRNEKEVIAEKPATF